MNKIILAIMVAALFFQAQWPAFAQTKQPPKPAPQQKPQKPQKPLADAFSKAIRSVVKIEAGDNERVGSGVLVGITKQRVGVILTAYHVVKGSNRASVSFYDMPEKHAGFVLDRFIAPKVDLALVFVKNLNPDQQVITFGKDCGKVGDRVAAIGNPLDQEWKLDEGILSQKIGQLWISNVPVRSGSSGGPLLDEKGRMLGVIQELKKAAKEGGVALAYRTELVIPTLEAWFEQIKPDKTSPVEEPKSVFTQPKYVLPAVAVIGGITYLAWPKPAGEPDLPGIPNFPSGK